LERRLEISRKKNEKKRRHQGIRLRNRKVQKGRELRNY